jgi:hypothetical protein
MYLKYVFNSVGKMQFQIFKECVCRMCLHVWSTVHLSAGLSDDDVIAGHSSRWNGLFIKAVNVLVYGGILYTVYAMFSIRVTSSHIESDVGKYLRLAEM